tara:strand:- start:47 stop:574 length:528 start_codon:yes stop_codon:yes gene_type:complete
MSKLIITKRTPVVEKEEEVERCEECGASASSEDCDCVFCCVCGEVNMTALTDNMKDTCDDCEEEDEKTYKCSDCNAWVKPTESCCGEEEEERDWWLAHRGKIEFMTATEKVVEEIGADEWGAIDSFVDNRKVECKDCKIKLRIGCANNPSNYSGFEGYCDDCRRKPRKIDLSKWG